MAVAVAIILDTRRIKENQKYPVKLRVNHKRVTVNYQTVFELSKGEHEKLSAPRIAAELQSIKAKLKQIERFHPRIKKLSLLKRYGRTNCSCWLRPPMKQETPSSTTTCGCTVEVLRRVLHLPTKSAWPQMAFTSM